jgi:SnoaL-like domain
LRESAEVREAMLRFYELRSAGDVEGLKRMLSDEATLMIGTTEDEWMDDRASWIGEGALRMEPGDTRAWEDDHVGMFADRPTLVLPDGGRVRTRMTAVLRKEGDDWKLVSAHFSVGVPDEEVVELQARWGSRT